MSLHGPSVDCQQSLVTSDFRITSVTCRLGSYFIQVIRCINVLQEISRKFYRIGGSVVECSPATRAARVRFPADAFLLVHFRRGCFGEEKKFSITLKSVFDEVELLLILREMII